MKRSVRAFKALLSLYPRDFRDEYGREMVLVFADRYRDATSRQERFSVWIEALLGLLNEIPKEHSRMFLQDIRYAFRTLRASPLFAFTVIVALALGIGANSAIFSVLNAVVLRTLPIPHPEQLRLLRQQSDRMLGFAASWSQFGQMRQAGGAEVELAAMGRQARMYARIGAAAGLEPIGVQLVSGEYFNVLRVSAARGRLFSPEDNRTPDAHPVAVVSHGFWQRRLGAATDVVGKEITVNGVSFSIVGVANEGFSGVWLEQPTEVWLPLAMQSDVRYSQNYTTDGADMSKSWMSQLRIWWLDVIARIPDGADSSVVARLTPAFQQTQAFRAEGIADAEIRRQFLQRRLTLEPFDLGSSLLRLRFTRPLYALMAMAGVVLLIACANAANLLLARAAGRRQEMALRFSLGAGRARLVRQLLTESLLLVSAAAVLAIVLARWTADALVRTATASMNGAVPFTAEVDGRWLAFTAVVALGAAVVFGLIPAIRATRVDPVTDLKTGGRKISGVGATTSRVLVVFQVALSLLLVVGAGLLVRSMQNILRIDLGFQQAQILSVAIDPRLAGYEREQLPGLYQRLLERVKALPGVQQAAFANCGIMTNCRGAEDGLNIEGYEPRPGEQVLVINKVVGPDYFETLGIRLKAGRPLDERDRHAPGLPTVVNETFVRRFSRDSSPIGKKFGYQVMDREIVGVVEDMHALSVKDPPEPMAFFPFQQERLNTPRDIVIRTTGNPAQSAGAVRRAFAEVAPTLPIEGIVTLSERVNNNLSQERLLLWLTTAFGTLALLLASLGLFGLLSHAVTQRMAEFGLRMALGAPRGFVLWTVVRESLLLALVGIAIGVPLLLAGSELMKPMLFEVQPRDSWTMATAFTVLIVVAAVAGLFPAWRASRVDPVVALRSE
jgi:putative ABC transport system permease protein